MRPLEEEARHELGNLLAIALANIEGMVDGVVAPTASRLEAVAEALREACKLAQPSEHDTE